MRMVLAGLAALALGACPTNLRPSGSETFHPVAADGSESRVVPAIPRPPLVVAETRPGDAEGLATLVVTIRWPERDRVVASLHPTTERIAFELKGPGQLPALDDLTRPGGGSLVKATSVQLAVVDGIEIRATAFAPAGAVVGQSLWTAVRLRRNARVDVPIEILPASGTSQLTAALMAPTISAVFPDRGYPQLTDVVMKGTNFGFGQGFGAVKFGGQDAGQASVWTDSIAGGATISVQVPPGARTGPIQVRLGGSASTQSTVWPSPGNEGGDPWSGHFTVLGPAGEPHGVDTGTLGDHQLAWDGSRFWIFWTKAGGGGMELLASALTPDSPTTVSSLSKGATVTIRSAQGIQLGGFAADSTGIWISWQETGAAAMMAHVTPTATVPDKTVTLTNTPAVWAQPVLARANDGRLVAAWVDSRDSQVGGPTKNRIYALGFKPSGETLGTGQPIPVQESNGPVGSTITYVGTPSIAVGKTSYLISWQETYTTSWGLRFQPWAFSGNRLYYQQQGGWYEAGPGQSEFMNTPLPKLSASRSDEDGRILYNARDDDFVITYASRLGSSTGQSSDIYLHHIDYTGKPVGSPVQIADDTQRQGRIQCPSFDPGMPCGQGLRHDPQVAWNGRDYMLAWQMDRDDGEVDIIGARLQRDAQADFLRAPEEPTSPKPGEGYPRSVA